MQSRQDRNGTASLSDLQPAETSDWKLCHGLFLVGDEGLEKVGQDRLHYVIRQSLGVEIMGTRSAIEEAILETQRSLSGFKPTSSLASIEGDSSGMNLA